MATAAKLTEDYLTCTICCEVFSDPATLLCDHTFCRKCLLEYTKTQPEAISANSIPCPVCKQMTRVTSPEKPVEDWVNQVKPSRMMQGLMDDFGPGTELKVDDSTCNECKKVGKTSPASVWCSDCEVALCGNCRRLHGRMPNSCDHTTHAISDDTTQKPDKAFFCTIHHNEAIKLFCKDCKKAICHICSGTDHRSCKMVVSMKESLPDVTSSLLKMNEQLMKRISLCNNRIAKCGSQEKEILDMATQVAAEVKSYSQKAIETIKAKEKTLTDEVDEIRKSETEQLRADVKAIEITKQVYEQKSQFIDKAVKSENLADIYAMYERCESEDKEKKTDSDTEDELDSQSIGMDNEQNFPEEDHNIPVVHAKISLHQDTEEFCTAINAVKLGQIHFVKPEKALGSTSAPILLQSVDTMVDQDTKPPYTDAVKLGQTHFVKPEQALGSTSAPILLQSVDTMVHQDTKPPYTDAVKLDQTHFVKPEQALGSTSAPILLQSVDTMVDQDTIPPYITDLVMVTYGAIKIMVVTDRANTCIRSFYTEDEKHHQRVLPLDDKPFAIAVADDNRIVVTSPFLKDVMEVKVYPKLELLSTITIGKGSYGVATTADGDLVLCRYGVVYSCVDVLNKKGEVLKRVQDKEIKWPFFSHLTSRGTILVSDRYSRSLVFISQEGKVVNAYKPIGERMLKKPQGVASTKGGDILLVDKEANKVIQLTESGVFVRDILTFVDGVIRPYGIYIDENGLVYVSCGRFVKVFMFK